MTDELLRVYVDSRPVDVQRSAVVIDAIRVADSALADQVSAGHSHVTDSRGLPISADSPLHGGAILRVIPSRK